jgi:hypothetical protein
MRQCATSDNKTAVMRVFMYVVWFGSLLGQLEGDLDIGETDLKLKIYLFCFKYTV